MLHIGSAEPCKEAGTCGRVLKNSSNCLPHQAFCCHVPPQGNPPLSYERWIDQPDIQMTNQALTMATITTPNPTNSQPVSNHFPVKLEDKAHIKGGTHSRPWPP